MQIIVLHKYFIFLLGIILPIAASAATVSPYLEDLTWPEVKEQMAAGHHIVIIPTGGTEQNGPHMALGKHNAIVHYTAGEIARQLGNALVAPVLSYTPEGEIDPPQGHMHFPGTISLSPEVFSSVLEDTARSFKRHGFTLICFIGDSGPNQQSQAEVAEQLTEEWEDDGVRVLQVSDYYDHEKQDAWLRARGIAQEAIGTHAGIEDTSELWAVQPDAVRPDVFAAHKPGDINISGATGDSTQASREMGKALLNIKIDAAVAQIRAAAED